MLLGSKLIFTMNVMANTNNSDNKFKLIVFSSSSGSAFRLTIKSSKSSLGVWNQLWNKILKIDEIYPKFKFIFDFMIN